MIKMPSFIQLVGGRLFLRYLVFLVASFCLLSAITLQWLAHQDAVKDSNTLYSRIGNVAGRSAIALSHMDLLSDDEDGNNFLTVLMADPAIQCAEILGLPEGKPPIMAPRHVGCEDMGHLNHLDLPIPMRGVDLTLRVRYSEDEISVLTKSRMTSSLIFIAIGLCMTLFAGGFGFQLIVGRPLARLMKTMQKLKDHSNDMATDLPLVESQSGDEFKSIEKIYDNLQGTLNTKITALKKANLTDALTEIPNRAEFNNVLGRYYATTASDMLADKFAVVHFIGLDNFKRINDMHGHSAGDTILIETARRLKTLINETNFLARLGGDEFVVFQRNISARQEAEEFAKRIMSELSLPHHYGTQSITCTASIGLAFAPSDGLTSALLTRNADLALTKAKSDGGNIVRLFDVSLIESLRRKRRLEVDMQEALIKGEFDIFFQPIVDMVQATIQGYEALLRWRHPELGMISPVEFIPIAEETGMIIPIGAWVLRESCAKIAAASNTQIISVNLSPVQFRNRNLVEMVKSVLRDTNLAPERLVLELTESILIANNDETLQVLDALHHLGIKIALDDFGTGYSSLSYLHKFRFDKLKIDRSFVTAIETSTKNIAVVRAVISLSKELNISTIVEGIETKSQENTLFNLGCVSAQGYLFGKPKPANDWLDLRITAS